MKAVVPTVLVAVCLLAWSVLAGDGQGPEGSPGEDTKFPSLFMGTPQISIEGLRKENLELKAIIAQLTKRVASLERRLSLAEKGNIRLLSDEIQMPDTSPEPGRFQIPIEIERGMQADAVMSGRKFPPEAGTIIWGIDVTPTRKPRSR